MLHIYYSYIILCQAIVGALLHSTGFDTTLQVHTLQSNTLVNINGYKVN